MAAISNPIFFCNAFHNVKRVPCPRQFDELFFISLCDLEKDRKKLKNGAKNRVNWIPLAPTLFATKILNFSNIKAFLQPFSKNALNPGCTTTPFFARFCVFILREPLEGADFCSKKGEDGEWLLFQTQFFSEMLFTMLNGSPALVSLMH